MEETDKKFTISEQILISNEKIQKKMRTLFFLRNIHSLKSAKTLLKGIKNKSVLLKHEICYILGQMQFEETKKDLIDILNDENENEVVRHEAAEALGNYKDKSLIPILEPYVNYHNIPIRESCILAIEKLKDKGSEPSPFDSFDPAFALNDYQKAIEIFCNPNEDLYLRYKAMFKLRDQCNDESVKILSKGFKDKSALLKHEIAFVMGQMRLESSVKYLNEVLENTDEHPMVLHEAIEALGAIGNDECVEILKKFENHESQIVSESAIVALDVINCERNNLDYCEII